jgi:hypothetical protein
MIDFSKIAFKNPARQRLLQIYAVLYFMEQGQLHTLALNNALKQFPQVRDIQTIRDKCARQFAGNIGTFVEWRRLGLIISKLKTNLHIEDHDLNIFSELLTKKENTADSLDEMSGIFGNHEENKSIEEFAVRYATEFYKRNGWYVESVESLKCGFDLLCTHNEEIRNVEVKGTSGEEIKFILTKNEYKEANDNPNFILFVVINAKSNIASHCMINKFELLKDCAITPLEYLIQKKPLA